MQAFRSAFAMAALSLTLAGDTSAQFESHGRDPLQRLTVLTVQDPGQGLLSGVQGGPPWQYGSPTATSGGTLLRRFEGTHYVVHPEAGRIDVLPELGPRSSLSVGDEPQDVHVVGSVAWVSRRDEARLLRVDLASGRMVESVDLSPLAGGVRLALGTMERDGDLLFVQVRVILAVPGEPDPGLLAVVDLASERLLDVDPTRAGVQGIELQGAAPRLKMQVMEATRTLFVSATQGELDGHGAIEMVDLERLESIGFALSEQQIADLSGFVMTSPLGGYFVFHTDLAASTHLKPFTIAAGPDPAPEILVLLGDQPAVLAFDARSRRLYLPSQSAGPHGVWVIDTETNQVLGNGPIPTPGAAHDVLAGSRH